jgi:hypothetical protein
MANEQVTLAQAKGMAKSVTKTVTKARIPVASKKLITTLETITPGVAAAYLEQNTTNRRMRYQWRDMLASAITEGRWRLTHQGIAFNCDGTLIDGQHRLAAIVKAGKPVQMYVTRGMPKDALYAIDQGKGRSVVDVAGPVGVNMDIKGRTVAIARAMFDGMSTVADRISGRCGKTNEQWIQYILKHGEAIEFARDSLRTNPYKHSVICGVVARAYYNVDHARLREFCVVFQNNIGQGPADSAALTFAKWFLPQSSMMSNGPARFDLYCKTEAAISAFAEHRPLRKLYAVTSELFPLPGEEG